MNFDDPFVCGFYNFVPDIIYKPAAPAVRRILFNDPATVVFWKDGTKTVVKATDSDKYVPYYGFLAALAKKIYGSNAKVQEMIRPWLPKEDDVSSAPPEKKKSSALEDMLFGKDTDKGDTDSNKELDELFKFLGMLTFMQDMAEKKEKKNARTREHSED